MKKFLNGLFNVFWVIFVGITGVISSALTGIALFVSLIGIPFGLQHFKFIPLIFAPAGKRVVTKFCSHFIMNSLWLILGGFITLLVQYALGIVLCITIIGIPLAKQLFKIASFNFAPFGAEIIKDDEYSKDCDRDFDLRLLFRRILADPDKVISTDENGNPVTARQYLEIKRTDYAEYEMRHKNTFMLFLEVFSLLFVAAITFSIMAKLTQNFLATLIVIILICFSYNQLLLSIKSSRLAKNVSFIFKDLFPHYSNDNPILTEKQYNKKIKEVFSYKDSLSSTYVGVFFKAIQSKDKVE